MVRVYEDAEELARAVADVVVRAAAESIAAREGFRLAVPGGRTPARLYALLASDGYREKIDWSRVTILFADERAVSPAHPDSNYRLVRAALIGPAGIPEENVRRMRGEVSGLQAEARDYEAFLLEPIDLLVLGVGSDGHIASIFPGTSAAEKDEDGRVVVVTNSPKPPPSRLTLTPRAIREAREVAVMVSGPDKAEVVAQALTGEGKPSLVPARWVRDRDWYLDRKAAKLLPDLAHRQAESGGRG